MSELINPSLTAPPYISKVRVRDYAPLRAASVTFKRGLNIIIGSNGAGKTRFLTLLNDLADLRETKKRFLGAGCQVVFGGGFGKKDHIVIDFQEEKEYDAFGLEPVEWTTQLSTQLYARFTDTYSEYLAETNALDNFLAQYPPVLITHGTPAFGLPFLDESAELIVEKTGVTIQLKDGSKRISELNSQFAQVLMQSIFDSVRYHFATKRHSVAPTPVDTDVVRQKIIRLVDTYAERLNNYLPYYSPIQAVRSSEYFQVYYQASQDQFTIKGLALEYQLSDEWISFRMLSDGTKRMMFILAEIFAPEEVRFNESTNEVTISLRQKIILLEEPELGIHPHQLHLLLNLIREVSREHQVIMTTHSPQVLDMLSDKELDRITICSLDPKKGTQFRKLSRAKQAQARRYMKEELHLSDYWRYSYLEDEE